MIDPSLVTVAASAAGAFASGVWAGRKVQRELDSLRQYLCELARHVNFRPPPDNRA